MEAVAQVYKRAVALVRDRPWLILVPVLAEFVQHVAEIRLGMYSGGMDAAGGRLRLGFGIVKVLAILGAVIVAWRLWRFDGDANQALRPTRRLFRGIAAFILVQIMGDLAALGAGRGLIALAPDPDRTVRIGLALVPLLAWLLVSVALFPWYVGLATEDQEMTLGRSLRASRGRMLATGGLLIAGYVPLMAVHYGLGYAAIGGGGRPGRS